METETNFAAIETIVHQGKAVVSSEDSAIIEWAIKTIAEGRTATLYLKGTSNNDDFCVGLIAGASQR